MKLQEIISSWEKIESVWEKKRGIIFASIFIVFLWFAFGKILFENFTVFTLWHFILIPILLIILTIWLLTTNRLPFRLPNQLAISIAVNIDEEYETKIKSLISPIIKELNRDKQLRHLKISLLPINIFYNTQEVERWNDSYGIIDTTIMLKINAGKKEANETIIVENISYTGYFPKIEFQFGADKLHMINDIQLRGVDRNWEYIDKNSLDDKAKFKSNLKDLILYYSGLKLLSLNRSLDALNTLKILYNPNDQTVRGNKTIEGDKFEFVIKPKNVQASRLSNILVQCYVSNALNCIKDEKTEEALKFLHEGEKILGNINVMEQIHVGLAYVYFLQKRLDKSKEHTGKIKLVGGTTFTYCVNMGFYAITENDPNEFLKHYSQIREDMKNSSPLEIISFLDSQSSLYPDSMILFNCAEGVLTKLFVDEDEGNTKLTTVINELPTNREFRPLKKFCTELKKKKWTMKKKNTTVLN